MPPTPTSEQLIAWLNLAAYPISVMMMPVCTNPLAVARVFYFFHDDGRKYVLQIPKTVFESYQTQAWVEQQMAAAHAAFN